jgi:shikimate kinase
MIKPSNVVLIGMPGSGKSTIGVILAKRMSFGFVDTDILIQLTAGKSLQDIVDMEGQMALRDLEERVLLGLDCHSYVIATGGSAVYSAQAMEHLHSDGVIVFLDVDLQTLTFRIQDYQSRGLAKQPDQTLEDLFNERLILYRRYADVTIECSEFTQEDVCAAVLVELQKRQFSEG